jgi:hypothetical protein
MNSFENPRITGEVTLKHYDSHGNVLKEHVVKNLVVTSGLQYIAARMVETGRPSQMTHMALGSSSLTPQLADTALNAQLGRVALSVAGGTASGTSVTYIATFGAGVATGAVVEAGVFDNSTGGTMLCRTVFPVINKGDSDSLAVTWVITVS